MPATLILRGATLIDGTGGDPLAASTVTVEGNRITSVQHDAAQYHIEDAEVVDLGGLTLLPGLIDAHSHFGLVECGSSSSTPVAVLAARIFRNCELALNAGFTTVRDTGGIDGGVRQAVDSGLLRGPRIYPSGPLLVQTGGHGDYRPPFLDHHESWTSAGMSCSSGVSEPWWPINPLNLGVAWDRITANSVRAATMMFPMRSRMWFSTRGPNHPAAMASSRVRIQARSPITSRQVASTSFAAPGSV